MDRDAAALAETARPRTASPKRPRSRVLGAARHHHHSRRLVDGEEATVVGGMFEHAEPQRIDRRPVVPLAEPEVVDDIADDAPRRQLLEDVVLEDVAGGRQTGAERRPRHEQQRQRTRRPSHLLSHAYLLYARLRAVLLLGLCIFNMIYCFIYYISVHRHSVGSSK